MLNTLITSETRIKLLFRFFLNLGNRGYLRQLANDFNESTNSIRVELNRLSKAKILESSKEGRNKIYKANISHPLFNEIRNIVLKSTGIDQVISNILRKSGEIELAFIKGDYAVGKDSGLIELVVIGDQINQSEIERVKQKTENVIKRKIGILILTNEEFERLSKNFEEEPQLVLMQREQ
ncbi:MAG: ArsR family transcriptional regulator [Bacteroidetes bacterium]|nr:ArsR family transcriptional regulator [Bacteroidota bacterium]MBL7136191.1 ArsR family transcriptional regulator [Candidatus Neomarinimicrobiota bacterium]